MKDFTDKIVVITGASSGIGRATALELARAGARLFLAARGESALHEAASQCRELGAEAYAVPTDVTCESEVFHLADEAIRRFGRIDAWINDAAVAAFGRVEEIPSEDFRRVLDTNLMGYVYGARAVVPIFRRQQRGTLLNVASVDSRVTSPFVSPYVISKWGVLALGRCLRQELSGYPGIHVCSVLPASIDTPFFQNAANYAGKQVKPLRPVYRPERVANRIASLLASPRPERAVGTVAHVLLALERISPRLTEHLMSELTRYDHFGDAATPPLPGNLRAPSESSTGMAGLHGGWRGRSGKRADRLALVAGGLIGLGAAAIVAANRTRRYTEAIEKTPRAA